MILYHHLAERPCRFVDQLGITTPPELFAAHMRWLAKRYDFVDLDAVLRGKLPRRPLLVTFDDGYRSVLDIAAPILLEHRTPSIFFLSARIIGEGDLPLDNLLCMLANEHGLSRIESAITGMPATCATLPEMFDRCIARLRSVERVNLAARLALEFNVDLRMLRAEAGLFLRSDEVARLAESRIEVGNHTRSHVHCRSLDAAAAQEEIVEHRATLEILASRPVRSFSFPYGSRADATRIVEQTLRDSGHEAVFLVEARLNPRGHRGPCWHRVSMQAQPVSQLRGRIEILPWLRSTRDRFRRRHAEI